LVALGLIVSLLPGASHAQSEAEPEFYSFKTWAPVQTWQYVAIPTVALTTLVIAATTNPSEPRWTGGILFDDSARNWLRLHSAVGRTNAATASDFFLYAVGTLPFLVDAVLLTGFSRGRMDLAWQMFVVDAEAITLTAFIDTTVKRIAARQRPFVRECQLDPTLADCGGSFTSGPNLSFFSGHMAIASTAATLRCLQHLQYHLYGNTLGDAGACGVAVAAATLTGFLRIMSDRHYASDVLAGALIGVGSAFLIQSIHVHPVRSNGTMPINLNVRPNFLGITYTTGF
jgi:membrane-associated phospholipid phosphatase